MEIAGGKFFVFSPNTFGARWFYQWNNTDPTLTGDAGCRITIDTVPEPSATLLAALAIAALISLRRRAGLPRLHCPARSGFGDSSSA